MSRSDADRPRLRMRGIVKRFGPTHALDGVDLALGAGEVHALIGENGAGKSTLMRILGGATTADAGEIELDGERVAIRTPLDARRAGVAIVHQELSLAPHLSVAENVLLGSEPTRGPFVDRPELARRARAALQRVGHGDMPLERRVASLSTSDRQLVEIARALALNARILVLDEPTSSLGPRDIERLFQVLRGAREQGVAIVYISHVLEEVFALAERFTVLRDGRAIAGGEIATTTIERIVAAMVGREVSELYPRSTCEPGDVVARIRGLASQRGLRDATLEVRRGEVLGIAGLQGAGRTELLRTIFGLDRASGGELDVLSLRGPREPWERWRQRVGMLSEDRQREGLALNASVADNLLLDRLPALGALGFVAPSRVEAEARRWVDQLRIKCSSVGARTRTLSGGNQQKVALARLLAADCDLLLLDEPTRGVDIGAKAEIYAWIDELAHRGERKRAVIVVSSYLPELFGICDRIAVMARGVLGPARAADELDEEDVMHAATGGAGR